MDIVESGFRLFLAFALGAVIGLEREINEKKFQNGAIKPTAVLGVRTFSLVTALGAFVGLLYPQYMPLSLLIGAAFFLMLLIFYFIDSHMTKDSGMTTEIAVIYCFLIGLLLVIPVIPIQMTLAVAVIVMLLLSQKEKIKHVVSDIDRTELNAFISFSIISLVILPFLPNTSYAVADIPGVHGFLQNFGDTFNKIVAIDFINPFKLWLIVALVTGVDLIGYILERTIGQKKGWLLASIAGGFVSSTATTQSLAQESKKATRVNHLVAAAITANLASFFQIAVLIGSLNAVFFGQLVPILVSIIVVGVLCLAFFLLTHETKTQKEVYQGEKKTEIINLGGAVKFALLFLAISIISKIALVFFGQSGFLAATGIGAVIGLDAVMISTSQLAGATINYNLAIVAFLLANAVNLIGKCVYSYFLGKKEFAVKFAASMGFMIVASVLVFLVVS